MTERQEDRDLLEMAEAYQDAAVRTEQAAWNCLASLEEVNRIERETATAWSSGLRDIIDAIDSARAELGRIK
jgi:hypothetical protein